jgi:hypothetical protein
MFDRCGPLRGRLRGDPDGDTVRLLMRLNEVDGLSPLGDLLFARRHDPFLRFCEASARSLCFYLRLGLLAHLFGHRNQPLLLFERERALSLNFERLGLPGPLDLFGLHRAIIDTRKCLRCAPEVR